MGGKIYKKQCEQCSRPFSTKDKKQRFCNRSCSAKWRCTVLAAQPAVKAERKIQDLKDQLSAAKRKLVAAHRSETEFLALARVIEEHTKPLDPVNYNVKLAPTDPRDERYSVDGVLLLADEHADQQVLSQSTWGIEEYNFDIFRCRLSKLAKVVRGYATTYLPRHRIDKLWIFKLGDAIVGDIHNNKSNLGNAIRAALAVGDVEAQFIQSLLPCFPGGIHTVCVSGNHPRRSKKKEYTDPHNNFDFLVATQMATRLQHEIDTGRCSVYAPASFTAYVDVRGHLWCLNHGDDVKGYAGFPWYGYSKRENKVQALVAQVGAHVNCFAYGHFHTAITRQQADCESYHAGNWFVSDPYAVEAVVAGSEPIQPLFLFNEQHGRILEIPIKVRDIPREQAFKNGEWEPEFGKGLILDQVTEGSSSGLRVITV
jgi:hypothetical protein